MGGVPSPEHEHLFKNHSFSGTRGMNKKASKMYLENQNQINKINRL
jgi:hypothetical protein